MEPNLPLEIRLPDRGSGELLRALHGQLREAILQGRLRPGFRLPPTRSLAAALGVSRNTAVAAYDLLLSEGYLETRGRGGTVVAALAARAAAELAADAAAPDRPLAPYWRGTAWPAAAAPEPDWLADFRTGVPDGPRFDFRTWRRLTSRVLHRLSRQTAAYAEPEGRPALRAAIAGHVSFARAVACRPEDLLVTAGAQQAFDLLARVLVTPGETVVAVEDPGYPPLRGAFAAAGARVRPVPLDDEGLIVSALPAEARIVCVTPSHQFPLGVALSPQRRVELLDWARARGAVVVEDDYDGEFRFGGRPLDALQTLDRGGTVFYVGTFSKSLFPSLRLGYLVAPAWARPALRAAKRLVDWHAPLVEQEVLAAFLAEGHLVRHVRRMRRVYAARREALLGALERHASGRLVPLPGSAGLHLAARLTGRQDAAALVAAAAAAGVRVEPLDRYALTSRPNGLVFGYGAVEIEAIEPAICRLAARLA